MTRPRPGPFHLPRRLAKAAIDHHLQYLILFVTARCNLLCRHCFYTDEILAAKSKRELSTDEYRRIAARAGAVLQVSLTGGEPFLRKDLDAIVLAFHEEAETPFVNVTTNGLLPDRTVETTERILREAPDLSLRLGVSLDGPEAIHDRLRARDGAFRAALETVRALSPLRGRFPRFTVHVSTTLTRDNAAAMAGFIDFVRGLPVDAHYLGFVRGRVLDPTTKEVSLADYASALACLRRRWIARKAVPNLLNGVNALMTAVNRYTLDGDRYLFPCVAGEKMLTIDEEGRVKPCEILEQKGVSPFILGDLRAHDYDLGAVLATEAARKIRRRILDEKCRCTFECANQANVAYRPTNFLKALALYARQKTTVKREG